MNTNLQLAEGEHYAGILLGKDGAPDQHIVLLPGDADKITWTAAVEWAATTGGSLPTRREQALLFANLPEQFEPDWYWSGEQFSPLYAWLQTFGDGYQDFDHKYYQGRARAVRRLSVIQ